MAKKVIKAKNVVSFADGGTKAQKADKLVEKVEKAADQLEEAALETAETVEGTASVETKPLNLRGNKRYLDDAPQDEDWADEEFDDYGEYEEDAGDLSTFAEVFIPLHSDSTAAVVRKGMAIVCVIVILCCIVALAMRGGQLGAIANDISAQAEQAVQAAAVLLNL